MRRLREKSVTIVRVQNALARVRLVSGRTAHAQHDAWAWNSVKLLHLRLRCQAGGVNTEGRGRGFTCTWWPTTAGRRAGRHDAATPAPREGRQRPHHRVLWRPGLLGGHPPLRHWPAWRRRGSRQGGTRRRRGNGMRAWSCQRAQRASAPASPPKFSLVLCQAFDVVGRPPSRGWAKSCSTKSVSSNLLDCSVPASLSTTCFKKTNAVTHLQYLL